MKKTDKKDVIEVDESDWWEEDMEHIKWKDLKVHHLVVIWGGVDEKICKNNKQGVAAI
jgi:hypothetical protein